MAYPSDKVWTSDISDGHRILTPATVTGYLLSLNGGPISLEAARQGGVTLSSSEAEFVAASQAGKEVLYLRALLKGFSGPQTRPTELWEALLRFVKQPSARAIHALGTLFEAIFPRSHHHLLHGMVH